MRSRADELLLATLLMELGKARTRLAQFELAEADLLEAQAIWVKSRGEDETDTKACRQAIVDLYTRWEVEQPGKGHDAKAREWEAKGREASLSAVGGLGGARGWIWGGTGETVRGGGVFAIIAVGFGL